MNKQSQVADHVTPVLNLVEAMKRLDNDEQLLFDIATFYLEDTDALLDTIKTAIPQNDFELIARSAHSLKGLSSNFDAHRAVQAAYALEFSAKYQTLDQLQTLLSNLAHEIDLVKEELRSQVLKQS